MSRLIRAARWVARKLGWNLNVYVRHGSLEVYWDKIKPVVCSWHPVTIAKFIQAVNQIDYEKAFESGLMSKTWDWTRWLNDATLKVQQREADNAPR